MKWPPFFRLAFSFPSPPSEGLPQCGLLTDTSSLLQCSYFFFYFAFSLSFSSLFSLTLFHSVSTVFHHASPIPTNIHPTHSYFLFSVSFFSTVSLASLSFSHLPSFNGAFFSPSWFLTSPLSAVFWRHNGNVDVFGGGPRRDRRGGGCYRLHPALPPHRPRQIPHQTQRSPSSHTNKHTDAGAGRHTHAFMHEHAGKHEGINMDTCELLLEKCRGKRVHLQSVDSNTWNKRWIKVCFYNNVWLGAAENTRLSFC